VTASRRQTRAPRRSDEAPGASPVPDAVSESQVGAIWNPGGKMQISCGAVDGRCEGADVRVPELACSSSSVAMWKEIRLCDAHNRYRLGKHSRFIHTVISMHAHNYDVHITRIRSCVWRAAQLRWVCH
jgi:hypothetical protein